MKDYMDVRYETRGNFGKPSAVESPFWKSNMRIFSIYNPSENFITWIGILQPVVFSRNLEKFPLNRRFKFVKLLKALLSRYLKGVLKLQIETELCQEFLFNKEPEIRAFRLTCFKNY